MLKKAACSLIFLHAVALYGMDYAVSPEGDDSNPGTTRQPFRTISRAVAVLKPGDSCFILLGKTVMNGWMPGKEISLIHQNYPISHTITWRRNVLNAVIHNFNDNCSWTIWNLNVKFYSKLTVYWYWNAVVQPQEIDINGNLVKVI